MCSAQVKVYHSRPFILWFCGFDNLAQNLFLSYVCLSECSKINFEVVKMDNQSSYYELLKFSKHESQHLTGCLLQNEYVQSYPFLKITVVTVIILHNSSYILRQLSHFLQGQFVHSSVVLCSYRPLPAFL